MATELAPGGPQTGGEGGSPLTRKIGPLPAWGWAVVVAGAVLVARALGHGSKAPTGGESMPGAPIDAGGDIGLGGGTPGPQGPAGTPGPNTVPAGYSGNLNQLLDWFQQLDRTTRLISQLRNQINDTHDATRKRRLQAALDKATGKTVISSGKFTYGGATYYQSSWLTKTINELQAKLSTGA